MKDAMRQGKRTVGAEGECSFVLLTTWYGWCTFGKWERRAPIGGGGMYVQIRCIQYLVV